MNQLQLPDDLKTQFIGWQCRIRQYSVRQDEGRPSLGMQPELKVKDQNLGRVNVQIIKLDAADHVQEFRFMAQKTQDPKDRYDNAVKLFSEYYYQIPAEFSEELTAVYSIGSELAEQIVQVGEALLYFDQGNQIYDLQCKVRRIPAEEMAYKATYWHNYLFNPSMPGMVRVLGFTPQWQSSSFRQGNL